MSLDIDLNTSVDLENLLEGFSPNLHILLFQINSIFGNQAVNEIIKLILGPVASHVKSNQLETKEILSIVDFHNWCFLLSDIDLKYSQKRDILKDILETKKNYEEVRPKYLFYEISDVEIKNFVEKLIANNTTQWEKTKQNSALYNWFVGQTMKQFKGKMNASKVMEVVLSFA